MKKSSSLLFMFLCIVLLSNSGLVQAYSGGSGSETDPYRIATSSDLASIGTNPADWDKSFLMTADIDMASYTGTQYPIIGNYTTQFTGSFDGDNHVIRNFTYNTLTTTNYVGLFGYTLNASIQNVGLEEVVISTPGQYVGGLVGNLAYSEMTNCYCVGAITGSDYVGGLVGKRRATHEKMLNCYTVVTVIGKNSVGGLLGHNWQDILIDPLSYVSACCSKGQVSGNNKVGGLIGFNYEGNINNCYSSCSVTDKDYSPSKSYAGGGLVGYSGYGYLSACYAVGPVSGTTPMGGTYKVNSIVGDKYATGVMGCYGDKETTGQSGWGKTTAEMKSISTYVGWDFSDNDGNPAVWVMPPNDYPRLAWEKIDAASSFYLTIQIVGSGTVSPQGGAYAQNTEVQMVATPNEGYRLKRWQGTQDDSHAMTTNTVTMDGNKTVIVEFEEITEDILAINTLILKPGKTRDPHTDSLALRGTISSNFLSFLADPANNLTDITLGVFSQQQDQSSGILQTLDSTFITVDAKRTKIAYKAPAVKGQPALVFTADLKKGAFSLTGKNLDLTGLQSPVTVELKIGNYTGSAVVYDGEASGSGGNLDLINGAKPIPVQFMAGYADTLRVDKCAFVLGTKKPQTDKLTVQGALTLADPSLDIAAQDITLQWGGYSVVLSANDMIRMGDKKVFKFVKPKGVATPVAAALFDLEKCTFKIAIANADIGPQPNPVDFALQFGAFDESVTLPLTQKNQTASVYP